jgi:hypothetical protein
MGSPGIALANSTAFTVQLVIMIALLRKEFPAILHVRKTLTRVIPASLGGVLILVLLYTLIPFETLNSLASTGLAAGALGLSGLLILPLLWPEIKMLVDL